MGKTYMGILHLRNAYVVKALGLPKLGKVVQIVMELVIGNKYNFTYISV